MESCNNGICANVPAISAPKPKIVNVNKWLINSHNLYLITYTGTWCKPCQNIKPTLLKLIKECKHMGSKEIAADKRPKHVEFIPWFDIVDQDESCIDSIQTSKPEELTAFLNGYIDGASL